MKNNTKYYYSPKQGRLPVFIATAATSNYGSAADITKVLPKGIQEEDVEQNVEVIDVMKESFSGIADTRQQSQVRHDLYEIIAMTIAAVIGNCDGSRMACIIAQMYPSMKTIPESGKIMLLIIWQQSVTLHSRP